MTDVPVPGGDPWAILRATTKARIGLGRVGRALTTADSLAFDLAHARARDAVHAPMEVAAIKADLSPLTVLTVRSAAPDRNTYIRRPDLGRRVDPAGLRDLPTGPFDLVLVVADGLSSLAAQRHGPRVVKEILSRLTDMSVGPVILAEQARVALADDIGEHMGARVAAILIGERPGLSSPDSLGIYMTFAPRRGRTDAERNCISNVHGAGLSAAAAAEKLAWLLREALRLRISGVGLKDHHGEGVMQVADGGRRLSRPAEVA